MLGHSEVVGFLFRVVRFRGLGDGLGRHIEGCPACQGRLASREEARRALFRVSDAGGLDGLWPAVREAIVSGKGRPAPSTAFSRKPSVGRAGWRWAAAAGGFAAAAAVTLSLVRFFLSAPGPVSAGADRPDRFRLYRATISGQPAQTIVVQEKNPDMVIVWVERIL